MKQSMIKEFAKKSMALSLVFGLGCGLVSLVAISPAMAVDDKKQDPIEKLKEKYKFTGKYKNCVNTRMIRRTKALDDKNILFELRGKNNVYLNTMALNCPRLKFEDRFSYTLRGTNDLCDVDIIFVLDMNMNTFGGCGLGKFQKLEEWPKDKKEDKKDAKK